MTRKECKRCQGSKKVWGDGDNEVPLKYMLELPAQSAMPGLIVCPPRDCPDCKGTGEETYEQAAAERDRYQAAFELASAELKALKAQKP